MKKNTKRYIAAVLAAVMLFTDCTTGFAAELDTETGVAEETLNELEILESNQEASLSESMIEEFSQEPAEEEEPPHVLFEVEELREQSEKQYRLSDGTILAAQYGMDIHYRNEDGKWAEIDNRFLYEEAETTEDFNGYVTAEGAVEFKFAPQVQDGELLKITQGDYSVGFRMLPTASEPEVTEEPAAAEALTEIQSETQEIEEVLEEAPVTELSQASISFLKGEVLNAEDVPEEVEVLSAEATPLSMAEAVATTAEESTVDETQPSEEPEVLWAEVSQETPETEEAELLESIRMDKAVTSVGYGNVIPGVSLQYMLTGSSLKEYILVNQKQESYSYDFAMNLGNLEPEMQVDGSILLKDVENGDAVYEIPAGYMTDAAGEYSDAVEMEVTETEEGSCILTVTADAEWINAEEREFPVQIDPTLNKLQTSLDNIRGCYVAESHPDSEFENAQLLMVGYEPENQELRSYIQIRNLPTLPANSVICGAMSYLRIVSYRNAELPTLHVTAKEIVGTATWETEFTWDSQPTISDVVMDSQAVSLGNVETYKGWNITELIKKHYANGNANGNVSTFILEAYDAENMDAYYRAKTQMFLTNSLGYPVLQIMYRDTKGIEDYYTYQIHDIGNAGTAYVGDYNGQLTLIRPVASYESTIMSYGLSLVYNSSYSDKYFTNDGVNIHSKNFTNMKLGHGWKLSAQETVTEITLEDMDGEAVWLVYNDSDGTEHYFKQSENDTSKYEDEDGLNLTITKSGVEYLMKDSGDNQKQFRNGYLTRITDAGGNAIHIVYNGGTASSNMPDSSGTNRITSICSQPKGSSPTTIFTLTYDSNNLLTTITEAQGNSYQIGYITDANSNYQLKRICNYDSGSEVYVETVRYGYGSGHYALRYVFDVDADKGMFYDYTKSLTGYRINHFYEYGADDTGQLPGSKVNAFQSELRKTVYRDYGADGIKSTSDDILTTYLFNSFGHTVNISSKDQEGNLLGVTAAAYEENSGTSKKNNRIMNSIATGQSGVNLLLNGGFEKYEGTTANGWKHILSGGIVECASTEPRSGEVHYELSGTDTTKRQIVYQSVNLTAGKTYTASVYVNTSGATEFGTNGGTYLNITDTGGTQVAQGTMLQYKTDTGINDGWQRISVTFTPTASETYNICLIWQYVKGTLLADDAQLEIGEAPSSYNHVYNGSFESAEDGWTVSDVNDFVESGTASHGEKYYRMNGYPGTVLYAEQQIPLNKSSDTTFLLSGWSKGTSIPDLEKICDELTDKFWGITVKLKYTDGTSEKHHLPFNEYVQEWQYAAMAVVPKASGKTILYAEVRACYFNDANLAYFDNISLTEEPAQTYTYDDEGNVTSVKSTGNGEESYSYDSTMQNLLSVGTEGSGEYTYKYENTVNKHLPTSITNDTVTMDITYDANGQSTKTTLKNSTDDWKMTSSATYSSATGSRGLLISQTDNTGAETKYTYNDRRQVQAVENAGGQTIKTYYDNAFGRPYIVFQSGKSSVSYGYTNGKIGEITRGGYITSGGTKQNQTYSFTYDDFGKRTAAYVGNRQLADYAYYEANGNLMCMSYGLTDSGLATRSYWYDKLDRVTQVACFDADTETEVLYGYRYSSDGNLAGITEEGKLKYTYEYDSLGRLIYSSKLENGNTILYTKHQYDTSDRLTNQSWQIGSDAFSESYSYSTKDGTLASMSTGGDSLGFTYNNLKQLSKRTSPKLDVTYSYRTRNSTDNLTTNQVETVQYLKHGTSTQLLPSLKYTYDSLWNITKVESGASTAAQYTYDAQNQLTKEVLASQTSDYTYDTYGNIRSKTNAYSDGTTDSYAYSYEDADWLDLLTKVTYTDESGSTTSQSLTYDIIGNPLSYFNGKKSWTFTWQHGRQLATATDGTTTVTNTYDVDGIRETKTVNGVKHTYTTLGGRIVREAYGSNTIDYFYDNDGRPYKLVIKEGSTTYTGYFVVNLQGDVIGIIDSTGAVAVNYEYDAWGKEIGYTTSGTYGTKLYTYNALKYRGYYYDAETGFYYVSSRYYDPEIGRFISADTVDLVLASQTILTDKNLYSYCDNNPIVRKDVSGEFWETALDVISLGASVVEVAINPTDPWAWASLIGDTVDLIPFITGVGEITKAVKVTVNAVDDSNDAIKAARRLYNSSDSANKIRKMTGSYDIEFVSGTHYVGKGNFQRAITSAKNKSELYLDSVKSITWKTAPNDRIAFLDEFYMQIKYGGRIRDGAAVYNKIWSPGKKYSLLK